MKTTIGIITAGVMSATGIGGGADQSNDKAKPAAAGKGAPVVPMMRTLGKLVTVVLIAGTLTLVAPGAASAGPRNVGAGTNHPNNNDWTPRWNYRCTAQGYFKVTGAQLKMWSGGRNRVKGFHFKYRVVPRGPGLNFYSNWSPNKARSFKQGRVKSLWMNAGPQGQAWNPAAEWSLQIKLKYPRSLRQAFRYKYTRAITSPNCDNGEIIYSRVGHSPPL